MLVYIIDGFNVAHKIKGLKNSSHPPEDFIAYIKQKKYTGSKNNRVIIVFDGTWHLTVPEREFEVIFSGSRCADDIIIAKAEALRKAKGQVVVVSDDNQLRYACRQQGARLLSVAEFIKEKKKTKQTADEREHISYSLRRQITEELRNIWLKDE